MGIRGWRKLSKGRTEWKRITEKAKNPQWVVTPEEEEEEEDEEEEEGEEEGEGGEEEEG